MTIAGHIAAALPAQVSQDRAACPRVVIIILNWNGWRNTLQCLESVQQLAYPNYQVVVVDNDSQDDSVERIRAWAKSKLGGGGILVEYCRAEVLDGGDEEREKTLEHASPKANMVLIRNQENLGFAGGNNVAIHYTLKRKHPTDYIFLLNNDAKVEKDCLTHVVNVDRRVDAGIVGAVVKEEASGAIQISISNGKFSLLRWFFRPFVLFPSTPQESRNDFWPSLEVHAAGMLIRNDALREMYATTGCYLDSRLFMYCEEIEFCCIARKVGYESVTAKKGVVYHKEAHSSGGRYNPIAYYYQTRNRALLANELLPMPWKVLFHLVNVLLCLARVLKSLMYRRPAAARAILCGLADGYRGVTGKWKHHDREVHPPGGFLAAKDTCQVGRDAKQNT